MPSQYIKVHKYRPEPEIIIDILTACVSGPNISQLLTKANLSYKPAQKYLKALTEAKPPSLTTMIVGKNKIYQTTGKGFSAIESFSQMKRLLAGEIVQEAPPPNIEESDKLLRHNPYDVAADILRRCQKPTPRTVLLSYIEPGDKILIDKLVRQSLLLEEFDERLRTPSYQTSPAGYKLMENVAAAHWYLFGNV